VSANIAEQLPGIVEQESIEVPSKNHRNSPLRTLLVVPVGIRFRAAGTTGESGTDLLPGHVLCAEHRLVVESATQMLPIFFLDGDRRMNISKGCLLTLYADAELAGRQVVTNSLRTDERGPTARGWTGPVSRGVLAYLLTSSVVLLGVSFGHRFVAPLEDAAPRSLRDSFSAQDGGWYKTIATKGYSYDPGRRSAVAFFPLFPLLGAGVVRLTGLEPTWALLVVAHASLAAAFVVAAAYLRHRPCSDRATISLALLALGLMPATFFFRMTYSESTFLLLSVLFLFGIQKAWPSLIVAVIAGFASASRPVGVGLLLPLLIYTWRGSPNPSAFLKRAALAVPVGCWGLLAYAAFLYAEFGDPLAFAKTQKHWGSSTTSLDKMLALSSYQPIWEPFLREPVTQWSVFTWEQLNPVYFVATIALIVFGAWRRWLNAYETTAAGMLLLIPYVTRAYEMDMASSARFAAVVFPVYLVLGEILSRLSLIVAVALLGISSFFLGAFSALSASTNLPF
jgi:hypothetical protein